MSEKQFKLSSETVLQYQIMNNDTDLNENEVVDCLNELVIKCHMLEKENEQLKQSNDRFADTVAKQVSLLIELRKENEQLKKARDKSDKFIVKKGLEIEFLEWCIK